MNIAVDIDDTLTNSFDYFLPFVAEYFGVDAKELARRNISYSNLPAEWKKDEIGFCRAYYDRVVPATPFKPDAAWGINKLRELGHRIIIITGRTDAFYTDPYKTTMEELANGGIAYDKLVCTLDKASACIEENISVLIDDMPANCESAIQRGISALLFESKGNCGRETEFSLVRSWKEAVDAIIQMDQENRDMR